MVHHNWSSQEWCDAVRGNQSSWHLKPKNEFHSLTVEYGYACQPNSNHTTAVMSSLLMWGALVGSFMCGFASDKFGRKPVFLGKHFTRKFHILKNTGCLVMVTLGHVFFASSLVLSWFAVNGGLAIMGFFCGGYMVTNFVILTEAFELPRSRLLVVSLNGWSISMVDSEEKSETTKYFQTATSVIACLTQNWLTYHILVGLIGSLLTVLSVSF